jgi:hypothetical protein
MKYPGGIGRRRGSIAKTGKFSFGVGKAQAGEGVILVRFTGFVDFFGVLSSPLIKTKFASLASLLESRAIPKEWYACWSK